jgi:hypothetical protein
MTLKEINREYDEKAKSLESYLKLQLEHFKSDYDFLVAQAESSYITDIAVLDKWYDAILKANGWEVMPMIDRPVFNDSLRD